MRNLLSMLLVFSFLFTIGCDDDEATDETNPLVGVYNMVSYSVSGDGLNITQEADANNSLVFVLSEGGTYSLQGMRGGESHSESGTWSTTGSTLTLITEQLESSAFIALKFNGSWQTHLSGNDMTMTIDDEGFTLTYNWDKE